MARDAAAGEQIVDVFLMFSLFVAESIRRTRFESSLLPHNYSRLVEIYYILGPGFWHAGGADSRCIRQRGSYWWGKMRCFCKLHLTL